jgi:putative drug exporter of the RND superfamily
MFRFLGRITATHPFIICASWLVVAVVLTLLAPNWDAQTVDDDVRFLPDRCPSVRGYKLLQQAFPHDVFASRAIFAFERDDRPLSAADLALVDECVADLNTLRTGEPDLQITRVYSHHDPLIGKRLVSADGHCTLVQAALATPFLALQTQATVDRVEARLRKRLTDTDAPRMWSTGAAGLGRDLTHAGGKSLDNTTLATVILVVFILLLVYRSPLLALVPLVSIALSVWVALKGLALLTLIPGVYLVNVSKIFAVVLLYGAGTDYCLFLVSRYREELAEGLGLTEAISRSVAKVGGALAASAGTVICGLGLMGFAEFAKVRCAGPAIALSLVVALAASLSLTPALLHIFGKTVFWPRGLPTRVSGTTHFDLWSRISRGVLARPAWVLAVAFLALAPLAVLGLRVRPQFKPTGELAASSNSVQGLGAIERHFTAGETGPVTVLLEGPADWNGPHGREVIAHLTHGFSALDNVAEVRSLTQPLGMSPPTIAPVRSAGAKNKLGTLLHSVHLSPNDILQDQIDRSARPYYVASITGDDGRPRSVTRLDVILKTDPFAPESIATLNVLETWLRTDLPRSCTSADLMGVRGECYGVTANSRDMAGVVASDQLRVNLLVLAAIFLILIVLTRRVWLAVYLLVTVLLSYFATLGATALLGSIWLDRPLFEVDWRVPFFLFTILVAVGEDYNIFLITRVLHERRRHGSSEGIRRALARTGGTITSCGLIMAGTFGTLMLAGLGTLVQIGFALAFGVLLDTFVIRPVLVPAFTLLVWRRKGNEEPPKRSDWRKIVYAPKRVA